MVFYGMYDLVWSYLVLYSSGFYLALFFKILSLRTIPIFSRFFPMFPFFPISFQFFKDFSNFFKIFDVVPTCCYDFGPITDPANKLGRTLILRMVFCQALFLKFFSTNKVYVVSCFSITTNNFISGVISLGNFPVSIFVFGYFWNQKILFCFKLWLFFVLVAGLWSVCQTNPCL